MSRWSSVALILLALHASTGFGAVLHKTMQVGGTTLEYEVVLPGNFDPTKSYPAVLAFGGGPQTVAIDQSIVAEVWRAGAEARGYIVVMPAAPEGHLFFNGSDRLIPGFLDQLRRDYRIEGGKFRVAGQSNGGISAFQVAAEYPQYFVSVTAYPGYLLYPTDQSIAALSKLCIHLFVGEHDELGFGAEMQKDALTLRARGIAVTYSVEPGERHRISSVRGAGAARLFDQFDADRAGCIKEPAAH